MKKKDVDGVKSKKKIYPARVKCPKDPSRTTMKKSDHILKRIKELTARIESDKAIAKVMGSGYNQKKGIEEAESMKLKLNREISNIVNKLDEDREVEFNPRYLKRLNDDKQKYVRGLVDVDKILGVEKKVQEEKRGVVKDKKASLEVAKKNILALEKVSNDLEAKLVQADAVKDDEKKKAVRKELASNKALLAKSRDELATLLK